MIRFATIALCLLAIAGCSSPAEYGFPVVTELNILDSVTVVFLDPGQQLTPIRNLMTYIDDEKVLAGKCYWELWEPQYRGDGWGGNGVWVMTRNVGPCFECNEQSIHDSLLWRDFDFALNDRRKRGY